METTKEEKTKGNADVQPNEDGREFYEAPRMAKKRPLTRVTLFSGAGATGVSGLTAL